MDHSCDGFESVHAVNAKIFPYKKSDIGCFDNYRQVNWGQGRICSSSLLTKMKAYAVAPS